MSAAPLTVLVVDDDDAFRQLLVTAIIDAGFTVVGEARDGEEAVRLADEFQPDVVTMDLDMPRMDGAAATAVICAQQPLVQVVIVSGSKSTELVGAALQAGARWHVSKSDIFSNLPAVLEALRRTGKAGCDPL